MKKVWKFILITVLVFVTVSFAATRLVYDSLFSRYDPEPGAAVEDRLLELRQEVSFLSGDTALQGYYYPGESRDVLFVIVPGFHAGSDDYQAQIGAFLELGWGVFSFDATGSCKSGGESAVGFSQELLDLDAALDYLEQNDRLGYANVVLFGHSRGGYAVCCALALEHRVDAVISVSGINSAMEGVMEPAADAVGPIAYLNYPFLWAYQAMLFGRETVNLDAAEILSETQVPVLIVHSKDDRTVSPDAYSIVSHQEEIQSPAVEFLTLDGTGGDGHTEILFDADGSANDFLIAKIEDFVLRSLE